MAGTRDKVDLWERAWQWGPGFVILVILFMWFRPHIDTLLQKHSVFLDKTVENQAKMEENQRGQNQILSATQAVLNRLDTETVRNGEVLRDIHSRLTERGRRVLGESEPKTSEIVAAPK